MPSAGALGRWRSFVLRRGKLAAFCATCIVERATMKERWNFAARRTTPLEINFAACPLNNFYRSWLQWVRRMIRLIASPARSGFFSRSLILFYCPCFLWASTEKKNYFWFVCCCSGQDSELEPFELWEYSFAKVCALIKVLRQSSMKNMCVSDLFASFA